MINICKECGQEFEASSARIKYCSRIHYRPCPICGEPVEAKYLSDPPRKCNKCKGAKSMKPASAPVHQLFKLPALEDFMKPKASEPKVSNTTITEPVMVKPVDDAEAKQYTGPDVCGFIHGHYYHIDVEKKDGLYWITATKDITEDLFVDYVLMYSSKISIDQRFV